eukprot:gnl/Dysnectes_brevis/10085_a19472_132.p2 GENE.gnl/Dysnectes_brevis/10085_a19472_132~~gnl/Dysnectes_brevis/10085_a19472_132.p2  ORF type:complete len:222 (+),score=38.35 gnl/Dysnectes_brevis/10085_a19472_132:1612-2277(+)
MLLLFQYQPMSISHEITSKLGLSCAYRHSWHAPRILVSSSLHERLNRTESRIYTAMSGSNRQLKALENRTRYLQMRASKAHHESDKQTDAMYRRTLCGPSALADRCLSSPALTCAWTYLFQTATAPVPHYVACSQRARARKHEAWNYWVGIGKLAASTSKIRHARLKRDRYLASRRPDTEFRHALAIARRNLKLSVDTRSPAWTKGRELLRSPMASGISAE